MAKVRPKVALYWTASCGGCETTIVDMGLPILDLADKVDFVMWPVALDFKRHHIEAMKDKTIDLCLFNGAIRSSEQEEMAKLFRAKSKVLVAFGACAHLGGIPGLANFSDKEKTIYTVYKDLSTVKGETNVPKNKVTVKEGELELPVLYDRVYPLNEIVDVDYFLPGCPPTSKEVVRFLQAFLNGKAGEKGSVFGLKKNLCSECKRTKKDKAVKVLYRSHEKIADPKECLLDQGFLCMGPVTRAGCETLCINANMSCRGCYGPTDDIKDMGGAYLSALASIIDSNDEKEIKKIVEKIGDLTGTIYRFSLPTAVIKKTKGSTGR